jgi:hypothetical protein
LWTAVTVATTQNGGKKPWHGGWTYLVYFTPYFTGDEVKGKEEIGSFGCLD